MSREYMTQQRLKSQEEHVKFQETCKKLLKLNRTSQRCSQSTVSVTFSNIVNSSNDKHPGQRIFGPMNVNEQTTGFSYRYNKYSVDSCDAVRRVHHDDAINDSDGNTTKFETSMLNDKNDYRNSESLIKRDLRLKCEMLVHGDEENVGFFVDREEKVCEVIVSVAVVDQSKKNGSTSRMTLIRFWDCLVNRTRHYRFLPWIAYCITHLPID